MAKRKKNERVILEDIELQPQVIGYTYKKKSNIIRVIIIFVIFALVIFYINDISVFINNLLGKNSASTIKSGTNNSNNKIQNLDNSNENNEQTFNIYTSDLSFTEDEMLFNNFHYENSILNFDIQNNTTTKIDKSNQKYFLETYNENKTLLERKKIIINTINENAKISLSLNIEQPFYYIVIARKTVDDYPVYSLTKDEFGKGVINCSTNNENIEYVFYNDELANVKHTINNNNINDNNYYLSYTSIQNKALEYNKISGITATFNGTVNGYSAVFILDLATVNLESINEPYYFSYKEEPKVVKFEMETSGFTCN